MRTSVGFCDVSFTPPWHERVIVFENELDNESQSPMLFGLEAMEMAHKIVILFFVIYC